MSPLQASIFFICKMICLGPIITHFSVCFPAWGSPMSSSTLPSPQFQFQEEKGALSQDQEAGLQAF